MFRTGSFALNSIARNMWTSASGRRQYALQRSHISCSNVILCPRRETIGAWSFMCWSSISIVHFAENIMSRSILSTNILLQQSHAGRMASNLKGGEIPTNGHERGKYTLGNHSRDYIRKIHLPGTIGALLGRKTRWRGSREVAGINITVRQGRSIIATKNIKQSCVWAMGSFRRPIHNRCSAIWNHAFAFSLISG